MTKHLELSDNERRLLDLIPQDGSKISTTELAKLYYLKPLPLHARAIIVDRMRRIAFKAEMNDDDYRIRKSERSGPNPLKFWIEHG